MAAMVLGALPPLACAARPSGHAGGPSSADTGMTLPKSNILRSDYVGSAECASCHGKIHRRWTTSPMHKMTRLPETADVKAPFDGATWRFKDDTVVLEQHGAVRFMRVASRRDGDHLYRVTRVIGGRHREDYAGVEVSGVEDDARRLGPPGDELILPVSFVYRTSSFRLKGYSVMVTERPGLRAGGVWNRTCIACHNTLPYLLPMLGALHGPGAPGYQGEVVDRALPPDRLWRFAPGDEVRLRGALADEIRALGGEPIAEADAGSTKGMLRQAILATRQRLDGDHLVEVGIGCEACHGGGREHVEDDRVRPTFEVRSPLVRTEPADGHAPTRAEVQNRVCARCHQVLFSRYPWTWEGESRRGSAPGGSQINSGEARDFLLGACSRAMTCVSCHDPHGEDDPGKLARLGTVAGNATCTGCHPKYAGAPARSAHTHHRPEGDGSACLSCHMPQKNMGLAYDLGRYHRIDSPTDRAKVERDRPLECALCHAEKTVESLVAAMERFWGKRYDRAALRGLYGDLGRPSLIATVESGKPHEKGTAMHVLGEMRDRSAAPALARELANEYPLLRAYARQALEQVTGQPCAVDLDGDVGDIRRAAASCNVPP